MTVTELVLQTLLYATVEMHWKQQSISYFIATDMRKKEKICLILYISLASLQIKIRVP